MNWSSPKLSNFIGIEILEMRNGSIIVDFVAVYNTSITTSQSKLNETLSSLIASGAGFPERHFWGI